MANFSFLINFNLLIFCKMSNFHFLNWPTVFPNFIFQFFTVLFSLSFKWSKNKLAKIKRIVEAIKFIIIHFVFRLSNANTSNDNRSWNGLDSHFNYIAYTMNFVDLFNYDYTMFMILSVSTRLWDHCNGYDHSKAFGYIEMNEFVIKEHY